MPRARTIVAGIDEAGYGPILGPLVASAAAFEVDLDQAEACLWRILRKSVSRTVSTARSRIAILDSKKLYQRSEGVGRLERSVLSVMSAWRSPPTAMNDLLAELAPDVCKSLGSYAWYTRDDPVLPIAADGGGIRIAASQFRNDLKKNHVTIAGLWSEPLLEAQFNQQVERKRNKAVVLFDLILRLIDRVTRAFPEHGLALVVDKQGGRDHYGNQLMRAFPDRNLRVLRESEKESEYELIGYGPAWRIRFCKSGETKQLPVALASLLSKYLREVLMHCFNAYWAGQVPDLKPTAGYYNDGVRFLKDIQEAVARQGVARQDLVRAR